MKRHSLRLAVPGDATCIAALSMQVFLDTYATHGVRPDLAREALTQYSPEQFEQRLGDDARRFIVAESGEGLVGFAEVSTRPSTPPIEETRRAGLELIRLYVQPAVQGAGLGRRLIGEAERLCASAGTDNLWLTAWAENDRALAFYRALGYIDIGASTYTFEDQTYETRILLKEVANT